MTVKEQINRLQQDARIISIHFYVMHDVLINLFTVKFSYCVVYSLGLLNFNGMFAGKLVFIISKAYATIFSWMSLS